MEYLRRFRFGRLNRQAFFSFTKMHYLFLVKRENDPQLYTYKSPQLPSVISSHEILSFDIIRTDTKDYTNLQNLSTCQKCELFCDESLIYLFFVNSTWLKPSEFQIITNPREKRCLEDYILYALQTRDHKKLKRHVIQATDFQSLDNVVNLCQYEKCKKLFIWNNDSCYIHSILSALLWTKTKTIQKVIQGSTDLCLQLQHISSLFWDDKIHVDSTMLTKEIGRLREIFAKIPKLKIYASTGKQDVQVFTKVLFDTLGYPDFVEQNFSNAKQHYTKMQDLCVVVFENFQETNKEHFYLNKLPLMAIIGYRPFHFTTLLRDEKNPNTWYIFDDIYVQTSQKVTPVPHIQLSTYLQSYGAYLCIYAKSKSYPKHKT